MNKRKLKLERYGISSKRYKELCGFCEQYPEWKSRVKERTILKSPKIDGMPKNTNIGFNDPTATYAINTTDLEYKCQFIEAVAKKASADLWEYIIDSVCYELPITYLIAVKELPLEKSAFYELRRYFFYLLDQEKRENAEKKDTYVI